MASYTSFLQVVGAGPPTSPTAADPVPEGLRLFVEMLSGFRDTGVELAPWSTVAQSGPAAAGGTPTATLLAPLGGDGQIMPADRGGPDQPQGMLQVDTVPNPGGDGYTTTATVHGGSLSEPITVSESAPTVREAAQKVAEAVGSSPATPRDHQDDPDRGPDPSAGWGEEEYWLNITLPNGNAVTIHRPPAGAAGEFQVPFYIESVDELVEFGGDSSSEPTGPVDPVDHADPRAYFWTGGVPGVTGSPDTVVTGDEGALPADDEPIPAGGDTRLYQSYFDVSLSEADPEVTVDEGKPQVRVVPSEELGEDARGCFRLAWIVGPVIAAVIAIGGAIWLLGGDDDAGPATETATDATSTGNGDAVTPDAGNTPPADEGGGGGEGEAPAGGGLSGDPVLIHPCDVLTAEQITAFAGNTVSEGDDGGEARTDGRGGGGRQTCFWESDTNVRGDVWISVAGPFPTDDTFDWVSGQAPDPVIVTTDLPYSDLGEIRMEVNIFEDIVGRNTIESTSVDGYAEVWYVHGDTGKGVKILASIEHRPRQREVEAASDPNAPEPVPDLDAYQATLEAAVCGVHQALAAAQPGAVADPDAVPCTTGRPPDPPDDPPDDDEPQVRLFALARPARIPEPGVVTFAVLATNTGPVTWSASALQDSVFGNLLGGAGFVANTCDDVNWTLQPGQSLFCAAQVDVTGPIPSDQTSTIRIDVVDGDGDTAAALQGMLVRIDSTPGPELTVEKIPSEASIPAGGQAVDFTVRVRNTSGEVVVVAQLFDDVFADVADPENAALIDTTCDTVERRLGPQASFECEFTAIVTPSGDGADHRNTLFAVATIDEETFTSGEATASIRIDG